MTGPNDAQASLLHHVLKRTADIAFVQAPSKEGDAGDAQRSLSWAQLDTWSRRWCAELKARGIRPGDRVAVQAPSSLELIAVVVAHHRMGVIHVPINTRYQSREVDHIMSDSGARVLVDGSTLAALHDHEPLAPEACDVVAYDESTAMLIYTSGTTGRSKGVALPFRAIASGIGALTELWRWSAADRLALALPLFHVHGLCIGVHGTLLHGMTAEVHPRFEASAIVDACERGATIFMGVPTMYRRLLDHLEEHPEVAASLAKARLFTSGSAALPAADHRDFKALTGHAILERYGMSETLLTLSNPYDGERRPGSVGFAVPGTEVRIVFGEGDRQGEDVPRGETGELAVRGPSLMTGYYGQPEVTEAAFPFGDGWFLTGDAAAMDEDGYIRIVGRKSVDVLKCGGFKISAREIEDVLLEHPSVAEAAVVGLPDKEWGQRIAAVVVARPDPGAMDDSGLAEVLTEHCQGELAKFKCPRRIEVWADLPRNALGKLQKHRIIERLV